MQMTFENIKTESECPFFITPEALLQFKSAYSDDGNDNTIIVRVGVKGGGCSGFMHNLEFIKQSEVDAEEDSAYLIGNICFVVDCFSEPYLKGTKIDYLHTLQESGFKFISSEVRKTCGCGSSFSR
jgi:iron-sulfur cluster assembly accessory protein